MTVDSKNSWMFEEERLKRDEAENQDQTASLRLKLDKPVQCFQAQMHLP